MKIILKKYNDRYAFDILSDFNRNIYSSSVHYFLTGFTKSNYKYAWEACKDAWKLASKYPFHINQMKMARYDMEDPVQVEISAEQMITTHYLGILRDIKLRALGSLKDKEEHKKVYQEIKMVINEINNIQEKITEPKEKIKLGKVLKRYQLLIQKYFQDEKREDLKAATPTKTASILSENKEKEITKSSLIGEVLGTYAEKICQSIQEKHEDAYYGISPNTKEIIIYDFSNEPILKIKVNGNLNVESVIPVGKLYEMYPVHTIGFYQKYWKPIVESIGHICIGNPSLLVGVDSLTLPDAPQSNKSFSVEAWNCEEKTYEAVDISFKGENHIWFIDRPNPINLTNTNKTAQAKSNSKYTEQDYLNSLVKCIDKNLKSIYGRSGGVVQVIPTEDLVEVDVDFGRGLGIVRLTEAQIEIIPVGV